MKRNPTTTFGKLLVCCVLVLYGCGQDPDVFLETVLEEERDIVEENDGQQTSTATLQVVDDAFVEGNEGINDDIVRIEVNERITYLKFDLSRIEGTLVSAYLEFTTDDDPGDGRIEVLKGVGNNWTEENLSAENAPDKGQLLGEITGTYEVGSKQRIPLNVGALDVALTSIVLDKKSGNDISISSKENAQNPGPRLVVEFEGTISDTDTGDSDEEGNDTANDDDDVMNGEVITLNTRKAFPSAFGAAANITGGRGGTIIEVTNLNNTGPGSFRRAYQTPGKRIIIIKVEGLVNKNILGTNNGDVTIWGQFAPGRGMTLNGDAWTMTNGGNVIIQHVTAQNGETDCTVNQNCYDAINFFGTRSGTGIYMDHCSLRYGADQTWGMNLDNPNVKTTLSYNMFAEAIPSHSTAVIYSNNLNPGQDSGDHTFVRNMTYNISHRFPNMSGFSGAFEVYNNFYVNWKSRLSRCNGAITVDWHDNYAMAGNMSKSNTPLNKWNPSEQEWNGRRPSIYSANNFIENYDETPSNDQKNIWVWFKNSSDDLNGVSGSIRVNEELPGSLFSSSKQVNQPRPQDGIWNWNDIPAKMEASVGHNRGIKSNGSPGFFRDDLDKNYISRSLNDNTPSRYREPNEWSNSSFTNTSMYEDSDGDHMPDWFENRHPHLDPNDASDMLDTHTNWNFDNYSVINNAGYTNLEICAEFYAGGFETMLNGTNKL